MFLGTSKLLTSVYTTYRLAIYLSHTTPTYFTSMYTAYSCLSKPQTHPTISNNSGTYRVDTL